MPIEISTFSILLVDDHPFYRRGVASAIMDIWENVVVHYASDFVEASDKLSKINIDIVITEVDISPQNGIELIKGIKQHYPGIKIIVLTQRIDEDPILKAYNIGVDGYLNKSVNQMELARAINKVLTGDRYYSRQNSELVQARIKMFKSLKGDDIYQKLLHHKHYIEIVFLMAHGFKNKAIAEILYLSDRTTSVHRSEIYRIIGCQTSLELVLWAIDKGVKSDPELLLRFDKVLFNKVNLN